MYLHVTLLPRDAVVRKKCEVTNPEKPHYHHPIHEVQASTVSVGCFSAAADSLTLTHYLWHANNGLVSLLVAS